MASYYLGLCQTIGFYLWNMVLDLKFNRIVMVWLWDSVAYIGKEICKKKIISNLNDIDVNGLMSCAKIRPYMNGFWGMKPWH